MKYPVSVEQLDVPGNASRSFSSAYLAMSQPRGFIKFGWEGENPYLRNLDYNPKIINFDQSYCTSRYSLSGSVTVQTLEYFVEQIQPKLRSKCRITEVGCGQGEFVESLRELGFEAYGFDPVLANTNSYLISKLWSPVDSPPTDLIVMRCVLPHIDEPWRFLEAISTHKRGALVLVEFQRLEWIFENKCWQQFCHDHVNYFSINDFTRRFDLIDHGQFASGEWGWALFDPAATSASVSYDFELSSELEAVLDARRVWLNDRRDKSSRKFIWGGAAKGTVLADAIRQFSGGVVAAIDANPQKWGRFLEGAGVEVISPEELLSQLSKDDEVLVANPSHLEMVREFLERRLANVGSISWPTRNDSWHPAK